jgi:hypothetical protein
MGLKESSIETFSRKGPDSETAVAYLDLGSLSSLLGSLS